MRIWRQESVRGFSLTLRCRLGVIIPLFAGIGPVYTRGGGDSPFLYVRLEQMVQAIRAGAFPVRWMPDAAYGLGYPFFTYYAALPYYVAAGFRFLGWGPIRALQVTQALGFVAAALAMALLARRVLRRPAAVALAVVAYTSAPFHLVNVYVRGDSLSEFYAFCFYPLILWALMRLRDRPTGANGTLLALSYGGLVLTHNLSAIMFTPFVGLFALYLVFRRAQTKHDLIRQKVFWRMLGGGLLGIALAATLWLPAALELDAVWMGNKDIQTTGFFNYEGHLRGWNLVQPHLAFDYAIGSSNTPFAMGLVQAAAILAGIVVLVVGWVRRRKNNPRDSFWPILWLAGLLASTWLITQLSRPLWRYLPILPIVQFPWRFLSIQALFGALLIGEIAEQLPKPWWVAAAGTLLLVVAGVGALRPDYLPIDDADITTERLSLFESFTTIIGTTIRGEYLPAAVEPRPYASPAAMRQDTDPAPVALSGSLAHTERLRGNARSQTWNLEIETESAQVAFHTLYMPGWQASIDGTRAQITPVPSSGRIALQVPRGAHTVDLRLGKTPVQWIGDTMSLAAGIGILVLLGISLRTRAFRLPGHVAPALIAFCIALAVLALSGAWFGRVRREWSDDTVSMDFDRLPYLHHNPDGINFGDARLQRYQVMDNVYSGETLEIAIDWSAPAPHLQAQLSLVVPASVHPELSPAPAPLAQSTLPIDAAEMAHALPLPKNTASGRYYLVLRVFDGDDQVPATDQRGQPLGTTFLKPVWVENRHPVPEDNSVRRQFGDRILLHDEVTVQADTSGWDVHLTWQATAPVAANYACVLHILRADGTVLARRDFEGGPGYGFWPTSAWPAGEWITDRLRVPAPQSGTAEAAALRVILYDRSLEGLPAIGSAVIPLAEREHSYTVPQMEQRVEAVFGEQAELLGYDVEMEEKARLSITLYWRARRQMADDWTVFVHLIDPATGEIPVQWDQPPLHGAYPTSWWVEGEVIRDPVVLDLQDVPPGQYQIAVGLYDAQTWDRPPVVDRTGKAILDGRLVLEEIIAWSGVAE